MKHDEDTAPPAPLGQVERWVSALAWTDERRPDDACSYNHCIAETPFGRFLITWKGWKDYQSPTADETPWGEWFGMGWDTVDEAKSACEQEFARRVALCLAA